MRPWIAALTGGWSTYLRCCLTSQESAAKSAIFRSSTPRPQLNTAIGNLTSLFQVCFTWIHTICSQLTASSSKQASNLSIHPFIHNLSANRNQSVYPTCLYISIPNTHQSALFNTQSFRQNPAKFWAKIGPACVLCDSHIFHLTAEREGKKKQSLEQKTFNTLQLSSLASRPSSSQKRKARCLVEDAQNRKKKIRPFRIGNLRQVP